jgi:hypothetical protein
VEVRLDNGEWAAATITAVKKPIANDSGDVRCPCLGNWIFDSIRIDNINIVCRLVYRISFDQPDDFVDLCLPNESVRLGAYE